MTDSEIGVIVVGAESATRPRCSHLGPARLGKETYEWRVGPQVEANHPWEVVTIDVDIDDWAAAKGEIAAVERHRAMQLVLPAISRCLIPTI